MYEEMNTYLKDKKIQNKILSWPGVRRGSQLHCPSRGPWPAGWSELPDQRPFQTRLSKFATFSVNGLSLAHLRGFTDFFFSSSESLEKHFKKIL